MRWWAREVILHDAGVAVFLLFNLIVRHFELRMADRKFELSKLRLRTIRPRRPTQKGRTEWYRDGALAEEEFTVVLDVYVGDVGG